MIQLTSKEMSKFTFDLEECKKRIPNKGTFKKWKQIITDNEAWIYKSDCNRKDWFTTE